MSVVQPSNRLSPKIVELRAGFQLAVFQGHKIKLVDVVKTCVLGFQTHIVPSHLVGQLRGENLCSSQ